MPLMRIRLPLVKIRSLLSRTRRPGTPGDSARGDIRWGLSGIGAAVLLVVAITAVYLGGTTPERTYSADLAQAGAVRVGDDVRIAGIPVGKVKSLTLLPDRVRMRFTVARDAFLGDQTTLDIRMLTIVGGNYVAVQPSGTKPLGDTVIPQERVILPYNLTQVFQDAVAPVRGIDGDVFRQDLDALAGSIGKSPDAVRTAVRAAGDLVAILDKQNSDVSRTLSIADEYLTALDENSDVLVRLLTTFSGLENIVRNNKVVVAQALEDLATIVHNLSPLGRAWDASLKDRAQSLADGIPALQELGGKLGALLDALRDFEKRLMPLVSADGGVSVDQSTLTLTSTVCVPVPGGGC